MKKGYVLKWENSAHKEEVRDRLCVEMGKPAHKEEICDRISVEWEKPGT
jgi:hypothetical protein